MGYLIKVVVYLIVVFTITTLLELLLILVVSGVKSVNEKLRDEVKKSLSRSLYEHIAQDRSKKADKLFLQRLQSLLSTEYAWYIFIDLLCRVNLLSAGATHEHSRKLFFRIKAEVFVRRYLRSPSRSHRLFALRTVAAFRLSGFMPEVKKYLNSTHFVLRNQALISWLRIAPFENLHFLCDPEKLFSIREMDVALKEVIDFQKIDYGALLDATHPAVRVLGLRLLVKHRKWEFKPKVMTMIESDNEMIREESRLCLSRMLSCSEDVRLMVSDFDTLSCRTRQNLVGAVLQMEASEGKDEFLQWIVENKTYELKLMVLRYLMDTDFIKLHSYKKHSSELVRRAYNDITLLTR